MTTYEVAVLHSTLTNYIVEAESADEAECIARQLWLDSDEGDTLGNEFEEIDEITALELEGYYA